MLNQVDLLLLIVALLCFSHGVFRRVRLWSVGVPDIIPSVFDRQIFKQRLKNLAAQIFSHKKILQQPYPGLMHLLIFYGFSIPLLVIILVNLGIFPRLPGPISSILSLLLDICGLAGCLGILLAMARRYIIKPDNLLQKSEDNLILALILSILVFGFLVEGFRIYITLPEMRPLAPVGLIIAKFISIFSPSQSVVAVLHQISWRLHLFSVLFFIGYLPYSKLFHLISAPLNIFFADLTPGGVLSKYDDLEQTIEDGNNIGVSVLKEYRDKDIMDFDACVKCGRCEDFCPCHISGKPLSPKQVIEDFHQHLQGYGPKILAAKGEDVELPMLYDEAVKEDAIWACTTCLACLEQCPVNIRVPNKLVDIRRYLVTMEGQHPNEMNLVFKGLENNSNPWNLGMNMRADWAEGLDIKILGDTDDTQIDILYWVGCAGAYDDRSVKISKAMVELLNMAGVNFAILGMEEGCCGETARRLGNEYLAQMIIDGNIETLKNYKIKKILTHCPHCYNTLKSEYPSFGASGTPGADFQVVHHSQFLAQLLEEKRLTIKEPLQQKMVLHDSCYLGRYHEIYTPPRDVIQAANGKKSLEMQRRCSESFCCGAGGGRMWLEENLGSRINILRTEQALETGADTIGVACPYCLTMLEDGIKSKDLEDTHRVMDLAEMLLKACK